MLLVRLACLNHAANVRSEPGSNPSIDFNFIKVMIMSQFQTMFLFVTARFLSLIDFGHIQSFTCTISLATDDTSQSIEW